MLIQIILCMVLMFVISIVRLNRCIIKIIIYQCTQLSLVSIYISIIRKGVTIYIYFMMTQNVTNICYEKKTQWLSNSQSQMTIEQVGSKSIELFFT